MNFPRNDSAINAIEYATKQDADEGIEFLQHWMHGDFPLIQKYFENVPESVFIGADPLLPKTKELMEAEVYFEKAANLLPKAFIAMKNVLAGQTSSYVLQQTLNEIESVLCIQTQQHEKSEELPSEFAQFLEAKRKGVADALQKAFEVQKPSSQKAGELPSAVIEAVSDVLAGAYVELTGRQAIGDERRELIAGNYDRVCEIAKTIITAYLATIPQPDSSLTNLALIKYEQAFDELFASCLSNGIFNRWGKQVDCTTLNEAHSLAQAVLKESAPAQMPDGWQLVPIEPTEAMLVAAAKQEDETPLSAWGKIVPADHRDIYKAMLASAPQPPAQESANVAKDAERWRTLLRFVGARYGHDLISEFHVRHIKPISGTDIMKGSTAQHFTEAIDSLLVPTQAPQPASEPVDEQDDELIAQVKMYIERYEEDGDAEQAAFFVNILGRIRKQDREALRKGGE